MADKTISIWPENEVDFFGVHAVSRQYMNLARAAAAGILFRYCRIISGFGSLTATKTVEALVDCGTPGHYAQIVLAEWLAVYAGLQSQASAPVASFLAVMHPPSSMMGMDDPQGLKSEKVVKTVKKGTVLPSLASILIFLTDWYGHAHLLLNGRGKGMGVENKTWAHLRRLITSTMPSKCAEGSPAHTAYKAGLALSPALFVDAANKVLSHGASSNPHPVWLVILPGMQMNRYNISDNMTALQQHSAAADDTVVEGWVGHENTRAPALMAAPTARDLEGDEAVFLVESGDGFDVALNLAASAPLQDVALHAVIHELVVALPDHAKHAHFADVVAQAWHLFPRLDAEKIEENVRRQLNAKYGQAVVDDGQSVLGDKRSRGLPLAPAVVPTAAAKPLPPTLNDYIAAFKSHPRTVMPRMSVEEVIAVVAPKVQTPLLQPRPFVPRRQYSPGPGSVCLYFTPETWERPAVRRACIAVHCFFAELSVVKCGTGVYISKAGKVIGKAVPSPHAPGSYDIVPARDLVLAAEQKTFRVLHTVVFTREDLLYLTVTPNCDARAALDVLWNDHHVFEGQGRKLRRFSDAKTATIIEQVVDGDLKLAATWGLDYVAEMAFREGDVAAADLLAKVNLCLTGRDVLVCDSRKTTTFGRRGAPGKPVISTHRLVPDRKGFILTPHAVTLDGDVSEYAHSDAVTRGLCLTTGQLALLFSMGNPAVCFALKTLVEACDPEAFPSEGFQAAIAADKYEVQTRLAGLSDSVMDGVSVLSCATHVTVS